MTPRLIMIVPSRSRPAAVADLLKTLADDASADLLICVDEDDPELPGYEQQAPDWPESVFLRVLEPQPRRLAGVLDQAAVESAPDYQYVGFMGDDHRPRTPGWAARLMAACEEHETPGIAYGDDRVHGRNLPTAVIMDSRIPLALGRMTFPGSQHLFLDNFWRDLGHELGAIYYEPDVIIEHLHPIRQDLGIPWDEGHVYAQSPELWSKDENAYARFVDTSGLVQDANLIRRYVMGL